MLAPLRTRQPVSPGRSRVAWPATWPAAWRDHADGGQRGFLRQRPAPRWVGASGVGGSEARRLLVAGEDALRTVTLLCHPLWLDTAVVCGVGWWERTGAGSPHVPPWGALPSIGAGWGPRFRLEGRYRQCRMPGPTLWGQDTAEPVSGQGCPVALLPRTGTKCSRSVPFRILAPLGWGDFCPLLHCHRPGGEGGDALPLVSLSLCHLAQQRGDGRARWHMVPGCSRLHSASAPAPGGQETLRVWGSTGRCLGPGVVVPGAALGTQHLLPTLGARSTPEERPDTSVPRPQAVPRRLLLGDKPPLVWAPAQAALLSHRHKGAARGGGRGAAGCRHWGCWAPGRSACPPWGPTAPIPSAGKPRGGNGAPGGICCHRRGKCRYRRTQQGDAGPGAPCGDPCPRASPGAPHRPRGGAGWHPHPQRRPAAGHRAQT